MFFVEVMRQSAWVAAWVSFLVVINLASIAFWDEQLAKTICFTFAISATLMMGLYSRFGYEKILGLGHILWVPLLFHIVTTLPAFGGMFKTYLVVLSVSITISLVFDFVDVWRYFSDRKGASS